MSMKGMDFMKPLISPSLDLIDGAVAFLPGKGPPSPPSSSAFC
jgi:sodium-dependent phosphate cotransporter